MQYRKAGWTMVLAGALALGPAVHAQQPRDDTIARLVDMQGNVLVSRESGLSSANEQLRLRPGTRVITTSHSEVVVEYDDGCRVRLKENQRFEVERGKPCAALLALDIFAAPVANTAIPIVLGIAALWPYGGGGGTVVVGGQGGEIPISPN